MTQLDNINLEGEWWTQSLNKAWSIGGAQYFATGAITTIDDQAIRTMFFNKDIIAEHNLKTIYDLVDDNEWVYEKFFEYSEIAKKDDGDGQVSLTDTFGACAQNTLGFMLTMSSGEMLVGKDSDDYPIIAATENATAIIKFFISPHGITFPKLHCITEHYIIFAKQRQHIDSDTLTPIFSGEIIPTIRKPQ
jgi:ABC-type glycerol-3-phosphate transport system substrate-binding protein